MPSLIEFGVSNSSPLIGLENVGLLELVHETFRSVSVPPAVANEVGALPDWISIRPPKEHGTKRLIPSSLGKGEVEVILLGLEQPDSVLLLDDLTARNYAIRLGLRVAGTAGLVGRARLVGLIPSARAVFMKLVDSGFRISAQVIESVCKEVGD